MYAVDAGNFRLPLYVRILIIITSIVIFRLQVVTTNDIISDRAYHDCLEGSGSSLLSVIFSWRLY